MAELILLETVWCVRLTGGSGDQTRGPWTWTPSLLTLPHIFDLLSINQIQIGHLSLCKYDVTGIDWPGYII